MEESNYLTKKNFRDESRESKADHKDLKKLEVLKVKKDWSIS